jgi:hypothetical protein
VQSYSRVTRSQFRHRLERIRVPAQLPVPAKSWSEREWERIQVGCQSTDMDDRWHALVENDHLYLHRSWTGYGIYEATFTQRGERWYITEALVETYTERYKHGPLTHETELLVRVIDAVLVYRDTYRS